MAELRECNRCGITKPKEEYRANIWWCRDCEWQEAKRHTEIWHAIEVDRKLKTWLTGLAFVMLLVSFIIAPLTFFGMILLH
jgi:hypothetical protein